MHSPLHALDAAAERCSRCHTPRGSDDAVCRRCGQTFAVSPPPAVGPVLILHQRRPQTAEHLWEVSNVASEVGRVAASITLSDQSVSRRHARIAPVDGGFTVEDLGSKNGTFVNNRQIESASPIGDGDELGFGDVVLVAELRRPSVMPAPGAAPTMQFGPEPPPTPGPRRPAAGNELTISEETAAPAARMPLPAASGREEVHPEPRATPWPIVVELPVRSEAPLAGSPQGLLDLLKAADDLAAWLHDLEPALAGALQSFESCGGMAAAQAVVAQAARVEANPRDATELQALTAWLPTLRRLLETELTIVNVLTAARGSRAHQ